MKHLNLNSLRMLVAAARHGSFRHAASELNLSQGAVSQRIKQLEDAVGVQLFKREPRGVSLTSAGQSFVETVETSIAKIEAAASQLAHTNGEVSFHTSPSIARRWLTPRLSRFSEMFPDIKLTIEARAEVLQRPLTGTEIAIRHGKAAHPPHGQQMRRLAEVMLVAVASPALAGIKPQQDLSKLAAYPLIHDTHSRWDRLIGSGRKTIGPNNLRFNSTSLAIDAAINAQGIAIAPRLFVQDEISDGRLMEVWQHPDPSGEYIYLVWAESHHVSHSTRNVVDWAHAQFDLALTI